MENSQAKVAVAFFGLLAGAFLLSPVAIASLKEMKAYKQAFPDSKVKCISCHAIEKPTKDGSHGLNAYGQAAVEAEKEPTSETFKKIGKVEDFKAL